MGPGLCFCSFLALAIGIAAMVRRKPDFRPLVALYRGRCVACGLATTPGMHILWHPETKAVKHANCGATRGEAERDAVRSALAKIEKASGPVSRRNALQAALEKMPAGPARAHLLLEASRIEVTAVLDKIDSLRGATAKRRHLETALAALQADEVPDELQREQLTWLEDALRALDE